MIDLRSLGLPAAVEAAVAELDDEVDIQQYAEKGANGYLFFGQHRIVNRRVAVKFYYWAGDRSHNEPQLLSEIDCPHIVPIYSARLVDQEWAIFQTPYYDRGDLDQVIAIARLSLHQAVDHAIELLSGISTLHGRGFVHRDLKPANIFVDDDGRTCIGDLGSAMRIPEGETAVGGTGHSALYRPPESFEHGTYDKAGDIYQAGIVLFQLLGGDLPYEQIYWLDRAGRECWEAADDACERSKCVDGSIHRKAKAERLLDLSTLPPTVTNRLKRIVRRTTRADPTRRYTAPSEMIGQLRRARQSCLDWVCDGGLATADCGSRRIRIVCAPATSGQYQAEADVGNGWRKIAGLPKAPMGDVARSVEARFK